MYATEGVGLAANQVARPWRLFVCNPTGEADEKDQERVFLNPEIVQRSGSDVAEEGCLSLPDVFGDVRRAKRITVEAFDLDGNLFSMDLDDLTARVVLHEADHLDGVMFPDRMTNAERAKIATKLADFEHEFRLGQKDRRDRPEPRVARGDGGVPAVSDTGWNRDRQGVGSLRDREPLEPTP